MLVLKKSKDIIIGSIALKFSYDRIVIYILHLYDVQGPCSQYF